MIRRIGIIVQGPNDHGFLLGLRDRFGCDAEIVQARIRGKTKYSVWRDARANWAFFRQQGADLVIRMTDSGDDRWQDVKREEVERFPDEMKSVLVCGVTEGDVERWFAADRRYLETELGIPETEVISADQMVGRIKTAVARHHKAPRFAEAVRHLVAQAEPDVFQTWLRNPTLLDFYKDCRDAALREEDCPVHDELRVDGGT